MKDERDALKNLKLSVVIPTINEEETIGQVIDSIPRGEFKDVEVIVVDTNSTDRTVEIAKERGAIVINEPRRGYGRAYKTGFSMCTGDIIATMDGDGTYPAEDLAKIAEVLLEKNADFVTCDRLTKLSPGVMSTTHRVGNWVLSATLRLLFGLKIKDSQSGMWVFKRNILPKLKLESDGMAFSEEIKIECAIRGFNLVEVPINYRERRGKVKLNTWRDGISNLIYLFKKRFKTLGV